jgi:two-component system sensor histidine kinase TctE
VIASLRARLVLWLLLPLSAFVAVCGYLSWRNAAAVADYVQDHDLLSSAKVLSDRLIWEGDSVQASVPPSALSLFVSPDRDRVFLSVTGAGGELLAGSPDFPLPAPRRPKGADRAQWYDAVFDGTPVRAVVTTRSMYDVGGAREITIAVGKTTRSRDHLLRTLWWSAMGYLLVALALAVVLATLALTLELRPIVRLSQQLAQRDPLHLDLVVDARALHTELRPVADTINRFVRQLKAHSQAQRRFIADAAHQLRTPLAMQASQIEYARYTRQHRGEWETRRADMDAVWLAMQTSNRRLVDVTNKLLLLAQAEHADAQTRLEPVDLAAAALRSVEQLAALADRRHIDLGLDVPEAARPFTLLAQPALLDALASNLLDNALRHTQEGGRVTVGVRRDGDAIELTVEDNGPGIPAEARERVFERFYRVSSDTDGTGLGLAIVQEIARAFGAEVQLAPNPREASGLLVTVRFRAVPA